jgi:hypothetical protein
LSLRPERSAKKEGKQSVKFVDGLTNVAGGPIAGTNLAGSVSVVCLFDTCTALLDPHLLR